MLNHCAHRREQMEDSLMKKLTEQKNFEETDGDAVLWTSIEGREKKKGGWERRRKAKRKDRRNEKRGKVWYKLRSAGLWTPISL